MKKSGIYTITNIVNGKRYIGSSGNIMRRWYCHKEMARKGRHHSSLLQKEWNEYGEHAFRLFILEEMDAIPEKLEFNEQNYIWLFQPVYNVDETVRSRPLSQEQRLRYAERMRDLNAKRGVLKRSPEIQKQATLARMKLSEAQVLEIAKLHKEGWLQKDLAVKFNVLGTTIQRIVNNKIKAFGSIVDNVGQNNHYKLKEGDVDEIIRMNNCGIKTKVIAAQFKITMGSVRRVVTGGIGANKKVK